MNDDELRSELGKLVRQLAREGERDHELTTMLREHLGDDARELPVLIEELHAWDLPNLQLALDAAVARDAWSSRVIGLAGHATHYHGLGLGDLLSGDHWVPGIGSPEYVNAPAGPGRSLPCLAFGLVLVESPDGRLALFVRRSDSHGMGPPKLAIEAAAPERGLAERFLAELRELIDEH